MCEKSWHSPETINHNAVVWCLLKEGFLLFDEKDQSKNTTRTIGCQFFISKEGSHDFLKYILFQDVVLFSLWTLWNTLGGRHQKAYDFCVRSGPFETEEGSAWGCLTRPIKSDVFCALSLAVYNLSPWLFHLVFFLERFFNGKMCTLHYPCFCWDYAIISMGIPL